MAEIVTTKEIWDPYVYLGRRLEGYGMGGVTMKNKIKNIALIIPCINLGGAERAVQTIGDYYLQKGYGVYYFLLDNTRRMAYTIQGEVVRLGIDPGMGEMEALLRAVRTLRKAKKRYKIDVAISFVESCNFLNVLSQGREQAIVSVRTTLSYRKEFKGRYYDPKWIRAIYNSADCVVAVSNFVRRDLIINYGIKPKKIIAIPNPALRHGEGRGKSWEFGSKAIVSVGRLAPVKQQDRIIRAFSYVKKRCPDAQLVLVGDGQLRRYLEKISRELKVEKAVHFVGFTDAPGFFMENSRVFVMASQVEGFPNAMVEAMSYGVPVVTTDSPGGCGEIIGKEKSDAGIQLCRYGVLTPYITGRLNNNTPLQYEEVLLGEAMLCILNDDGKYNEYSKKSMQRAQHYSLKKIMNQWDSVLNLK